MTPVKSWGAGPEGCDPDMAWYDAKDIANADGDLPCPQDPVVLKAMINRGMLIYTLIISLTLTVCPALLLAVGIATFHAMGIPVCGSVAHLEVLEDPIRCGTQIAWEFYVGIAALALGFMFSGLNLSALIKQGKAGMKRLRKLNDKRAAATGTEDNA